MTQTQQAFPAQKQQYPGSENQMRPKPRAEMEDYAGSGKLAGKIALVTGGDSGIGRAVAIGFAKEGADVAIAYLEEHEDARQTSQYIEQAGQQSLAQALVERKIRVNAVAPGPVWTPLIPSTMPEEKVKKFGQDQPMGRAAQPDEIAPSYIFFASGTFSSYYNGEVLAPIGGETLPG